jgi:hypothetical protein
MKSKFGTGLALSAVLLTGTAAAAINTQALITPTKSKVGTATTSLLPPTDMVAVETPQSDAVVPGTAETPISSDGTAATQPVVDPNTPAVGTTVDPANPNVVYGNPNPSNGEEDDDDDEYDDDDYDDEDEDDDDDEYEHEDDD